MRKIYTFFDLDGILVQVDRSLFFAITSLGARALLTSSGLSIISKLSSRFYSDWKFSFNQVLDKW
jgi:hypothetical protein